MENNKTATEKTTLNVLKEKLKKIELDRTPMSPALSPHVTSISPPFSAANNNNNRNNFDVSGFAPLDDTIGDHGSNPQPQRLNHHRQNHHHHHHPLQRHVSPPDEAPPRARTASDWNVASSTCESKRGDYLPSCNSNEDANFNGGLTLPTSASKKRPGGLRSYMSTPDTRALAADFGGGGGCPSTIGGGGGGGGGCEETGPRKRSLGKARRVLKTSESSTSPKEEAEEKGAKNAVPKGATPSDPADKDVEVPPPYSLGTIDESEDGLSQDTRAEDLLISDLRLSSDLDLDLNTDVEGDLNADLNASFGEDDLNFNDSALNDDENVGGEGDRRLSRDLYAGACGKSPLQELQYYCNSNNNTNNNDNNDGDVYAKGRGPPDPVEISYPYRQKSGRNPAVTLFPSTPLHKAPPTATKYHHHQQQQQQQPPAGTKTPHHPHQQQQQQQQLHPGSKTPLHSMRPPARPLFTPAQPYHHHPPQQQQQPQAMNQQRKAKFVEVNGVSYQLIRQIGSGGSCKVHQAADFAKQRLVAIKTVDLDGIDQTMIDSYRNEINILEKLQHSNRVVKLIDHETNEENNLLFIVMECGACDLATILNERVARKNITRNLVRFYWEEMLSCIAVIHDEDVVHSDLKPANFLVVDGTLKLIDFGIANAIQSDKTSVTRDSQIGTLNYMSPEAIIDMGEEGKTRIKIGTKSDVWSLGCILYSMVYAKTPFHHLTNYVRKLQAIIDPNTNIEFGDLPDPHLLDVMRKCLNRDPKARPSVDQLRAHPYLWS